MGEVEVEVDDDDDDMEIEVEEIDVKVVEVGITRKVCLICKGSIYNTSSMGSCFTTTCNHSFHYQCLRSWCVKSNSCPTCKVKNVLSIGSKNMDQVNYVC